jgi:hypothetical protein
MCSVQISVGEPAFLNKGFRSFPWSLPGKYLDGTSIRSLPIPSNLLVSNHPTIRRYVVIYWQTHRNNPQKNIH